ncbi:MAG: hypothetical protein I8H87_04010 [Comamonadaceae bacterium]|jgi:ATP-dependent DNA helicase RecG|nr:hypothetical protein [Comamonadaceae bacterium]
MSAAASLLQSPEGKQLEVRRDPLKTLLNAQVGEQVQQLLSLCAQEPLAALQLSNAYLNYKRHIVPVLDRGLIAMSIPDKPQSRLPRYRLTAQGRALLATLQTQEKP